MAENSAFSTSLSTALNQVPPPAGASAARDWERWKSKLASHGNAAIANHLILDLILHELCEEAREFTGAAGAAIAIEAKGEFICRAASGGMAPDLGMAIESRQGLSGACVRSLQMQICEDTAHDARVDGAACRRLGVRSLAILPLINRQPRRSSAESSLLGVLEVFSDQPAKFNRAAVAALQSTAQRIAATVAHAAAADSKQTPEPAGISVVAPTVAARLAAVPMQDVPAQDSLPSVPPVPRESASSSLSTPVIREVVPEPVRAEESLSFGAGAAVPLPRPPSFSRTNAVLVACTVVTAGLLAWFWTHPRRQSDIGKFASTVTKPAPARPSSAASANGDRTEVLESALPSASQPASAQGRQRPDSTTAISPGTALAAERFAAGGGRGGLAVYEKGKLVFRLEPQMSAPTARSAASQDSVSSPELTGGGVLQQVAPVYPVDAREQRLQGDVLLSVVIGEDGSVRDVQPLSGPAPLFPAAVEAVRQWRYEPFRLNGAPVSKPTTITIHFALP